MDKIVLFVKSTFCHEYMEMRVESHFLGEWVQHNNGTCPQSPASVPVGDRIVDCYNRSIHQDLQEETVVFHDWPQSIRDCEYCMSMRYVE